MPSDALQRKPNQPHIIHSFLDDVSLTMASVATVLVCVALPLVFAYRNTMTGSNEHTARTAQNVHLRRRVQHAASGLGICLGYRWVITDASTVLALLSLSCASFLALHQLRRLKFVDELYLRLMGPLLRPHEIRGGLPGAFWFLLGAAGAVAVFPRDVALQSILHLSVGDPVASVVGVRLGDRNRVLPSGKSLAGSFAAFVACSMSTLLLFGCCCCHPSEGENNLHHGGGERGSDSNDGSSSSSTIFGAFSACAAVSCGSDSSSHSRYLLRLGYYALLGGMSGAVGECLPLGVDDNLSMPIVSGVVFLTLSECVHRRWTGLSL